MGSHTLRSPVAPPARVRCSPSRMLLRSREENESLREPESQIEELSWTYEGSGLSLRSRRTMKKNSSMHAYYQASERHLKCARAHAMRNKCEIRLNFTL